MTATLLDVNVLIALFDPAHPSHGDAHAFFADQKKKAWATTPLTIDGFVRVVSNPAYPTVDATPAEAAVRLRKLCQSDRHEFWPDDVSLLDERILRLQFLAGHRQITDARLLALAVRNEGRLATFDRRLPVGAVKGATERHIRLVG
jgi:toxin-antitoxin system PIN domain toxin